MATTSLWAIKGRTDHVLDYAMNPEKTEKQLCVERKELRNEKRRVDVTPERVKQIDARLSKITDELKALRRDVWLCGEVEERSVMLAKRRENERNEQEQEPKQIKERAYERNV